MNTFRSFVKTRSLALILALITSLIVLTACSNTTDTKTESTGQGDSTAKSDAPTSTSNESATTDAKTLQGKMKLNHDKGRIGDKVSITAEGLVPNQDLKVMWADMVGSYAIEDNYTYIGTQYDPIEKELGSGKADDQGKWSGEVNIPDGFGDDHDMMIYQEGAKVAQANFFVETVFTISPTSGPIGTYITIKGEGLSWKMYGSLWHLNYDNAYTGIITAVATNGRATGQIRAAGEKGDHTITIESGSAGMPYLNRAQSPVNYIHTARFTFNITDDKPAGELSFVEAPPAAAAKNAIKLPDLVNKSGVSIALDKSMGIVGEKVIMKGTGLPKNQKLSFDWHTMVGSRVDAKGFGGVTNPLGEATTNDQGDFTYEFDTPDDLGGAPHLIDIKVGEEIYGQAYYRILPSIVDVSPKSGPAGTLFTITLKGTGWTEFDNANNVTYDNAAIGYSCGFNTQGTIKIPLVASGAPGYHLIDIYPGLYKGQQIQPNLYIKPQLTYLVDHPGTAMPVIRTYFEITK